MSIIKEDGRSSLLSIFHGGELGMARVRAARGAIGWRTGGKEEGKKTTLLRTRKGNTRRRAFRDDWSSP